MRVPLRCSQQAGFWFNDGGVALAIREHNLPVDRSFAPAWLVVLILAILFVVIVLLWPLGRLPWP
jgi:hypothetical protein